MRLTKIEINGFKSFAKKTEIQVEKGITAIIGPNGSGKSNIADAVRWVLGEQSAKVLRGNKMEDVIFNGTEQRKPQSFCEVTLVFDNSDGRLPTDFAEVSVTRRVYRSGESEYLINNTQCRLKDIGELFRDTGIGKEGYSIIGQGKVEEILSNKSNDRRNAFEEAAGVMKYRVRKEEAERKLENTRKNLVRLNDILEELSRQIGPLEEQSAAARQYLKLRDELKEIEVNVFLYQYDKLNERITTLNDSMAQYAEAIRQSTGIEAALAADCSAEEEKERSLNAAIGEIQSKLLTATTGVENRTGEAKVARERMANLARERERLENAAREDRVRLEELKKSMAEVSARSSDTEETKQRERAKLAGIEKQLAGIQAEISDKEQLLESQKNSMIEAMNRLSDAKSRLSRLEAIKTTLLGRIDSINQKMAAIAEEGEKLSHEYDQVFGSYSEIKQGYDGKNAERMAAIAHLNELNAQLKQDSENIRALEQQIEAESSRIKVLQEMKRAYEGYYSSVRNVLRDAARDPRLGKCIEGVVAELIRVPCEYESAIEMTLGSALQNIVTPTEQDAKQVIGYLRSRQYGRATMLPVSSMRPRLLSNDERSMCNVEGFIGVASDLVSFDERYRGIFENLLGRTIVVKDLDAGIAINRRARSSFRIATLKGDIINPGGSMTGGSAQKREFSLIGREREIETITAALKKQREQLEASKSEREGLERDIARAGEAVERASEALHAADVELATHREKVDVVQKYVEENRDEMEQARLELAQINDSIENIDEQYREANEDRSQWEQGNVASQDDIKKLQEELNKLRAEAANVNDKATEQKVALMALEKEANAAENEAKRMERETSGLMAAIKRSKDEIEQGSRSFLQLQEQVATLDDSISSERMDVDRLTDQLHTMEEERAKRLNSIDELRERRDNISAELNDIKERSHRAELNLNKAQLELQNMQDRIWSDYELTYENAQPMRRQIAITASHIRVDELKTAIRALGDVNVGSIEDYKNVKERYDELNAQYEDLTKAEADLQVLITDLVSTMEEEFRRQFALIQQNFSQVFVELFGGGRAELILSDKDDILNCDIDIIAQPPGKKLQLLSLLSGGERALTAIALLFAILKLKPTAFCILDEIESALDDANVTNFAEYVRNYSDDTQFILITHRKGSMAVCDSLYGVAMEERGVSKVVSAKFTESA